MQEKPKYIILYFSSVFFWGKIGWAGGGQQSEIAAVVERVHQD